MKRYVIYTKLSNNVRCDFFLDVFPTTDVELAVEQMLEEDEEFQDYDDDVYVKEVIHIEEY